MDNLELWQRFADIDPKFTKPITGKQYRGTSPNPHYVIRCLTEMFGPVGRGFGWEVTAEGFQPLGDEVLHWCRIRFWHGDGKGFDAYGQTKALSIVKRGTPQQYAMVDEDAPKKSLTDAITKAASQVGVAANIFLGRWDDSKYVAQVNSDFREREQAEGQTAKEEAETTPPFDPAACDARLRSAWTRFTSRKDATEWWEREKPALGMLKDHAPERYQALREDLGNLTFQARTPSVDMIPGALAEA